MSEWQPIETAPKDGAPVLLFPLGIVACWDGGDEHWTMLHIPLNDDLTIAGDWIGHSGKFYCVYTSVFGQEPTHWMHLPEPPVTA